MMSWLSGLRSSVLRSAVKELIMSTQQKPSKEQLRDWMFSRRVYRLPLPSIEEIRRQLGWGLKAKGR